jgi:hypothetical protein
MRSAGRLIRWPMIVGTPLIRIHATGEPMSVELN